MNAKQIAEKHITKLGISGTVVKAEMVENAWDGKWIDITVLTERAGTALRDIYSLTLTKGGKAKELIPSAMGILA